MSNKNGVARVVFVDVIDKCSIYTHDKTKLANTHTSHTHTHAHTHRVSFRKWGIRLPFNGMCFSLEFAILICVSLYGLQVSKKPVSQLSYIPVPIVMKV